MDKKINEQILELINNVLKINHNNDEEYTAWEEKLLELCTNLHRLNSRGNNEIYEIFDKCIDILIYGPDDDSEGLFNMISILLSKELEFNEVWKTSIKALIKHSISNQRFLFLFYDIKFRNDKQKQELQILFNHLTPNVKKHLISFFLDYMVFLPEEGYTSFSNEIIAMLEAK